MQDPSASVATKGENGMARMAVRRRFGQVTDAVGSWQARYTVPLPHESGRGGHIVTAPHTFEPGAYGKQAAEDWLRSEDLRPQAGGADSQWPITPGRAPATSHTKPHGRPDRACVRWARLRRGDAVKGNDTVGNLGSVNYG